MQSFTNREKCNVNERNQGKKLDKCDLNTLKIEQLINNTDDIIWLRKSRRLRKYTVSLCCIIRTCVINK